MFDTLLRPVVAPPLEYLGHRLARFVSADAVTLAGFALGLAAIPAIAFRQYLLGLALLLANRLCDGLDGVIARRQGMTDRGGYLDIVCDFIVYAGFVFAFALARPGEALWSAFLLFSFMGTASSFLAYAIMATKRQWQAPRRGPKAFYYLGGLAEGTETMVFLALFCLLPECFASLALIFGIMCWLTTLSRLAIAWRELRD